MRTNSSLWVALLSFMLSGGFLLDGEISCGGQNLNAEDVLKHIQERGTTAALDWAYGDEKLWDHVLNGIAHGHEEWLDVADALIEPADAGASFDLTVAMAVALEKNPKRVLSCSKEFDLEQICSWYDVELANGERLEQLQRRKVLALEAANENHSLRSSAQACVTAIEAVSQGVVEK